MKFWKHSLMSRLVGRFSLLSMVAVFGVGAIAFWQAKSTLETLVLEHLEVSATLKASALDRWVRHRREETMALAALPELRDRTDILRSADEASAEFVAARAEIQKILRSAVVGRSDWVQVAVLSGGEGKIWVSTDRSRQGEYRDREPYFMAGRQETFVQNPYLSWGANEPTMTGATPLRNSKGESIAVLVVDLNLAKIDEIVDVRTGLGDRSKAYLIDRSGQVVGGRGLAQSDPSEKLKTPQIDGVLAGEDGSGFYLNDAGIPTIGVYRWVEAPELA
ncbi:cache domain-containing protein, partial [Oscillatoriales cyanobacterium LEGE 11467]